MTGLDLANDVPLTEPMIRLGAFISVLVVLIAWELRAPRRRLSLQRWKRWPGNFGIVIVDTVVLRIFFPAAAVGTALLAQANGWGLFNQFAIPAWLAILLTVVLLDLIIYGQHVLFHSVPWLWRLHRMHHADLDIDVTTGIRFHPVEILLSMLIKLGAVASLGAPALGVMLFEILLNATSMFNHSNIRIGSAADRWLRRLIVTPDMHRVHHSIVARETHSNFGFNLSWWDRLFGTYRQMPMTGHEAMTIGIPEFRDASELRLDRMLLQPLRTVHGNGRGQ